MSRRKLDAVREDGLRLMVERLAGQVKANPTDTEQLATRDVVSANRGNAAG